MAYTDHNGYVFIVDRKADMIISGGLNVYPAEVEHTLMEHPAVAEVAVVAVPDQKWGEAVKAVVRCPPGQTVDPEDLLSWAKSRLAGYKVPKSVDFTTQELPKNPTGKLLRRALREPYWADTERQVG
jgi:acyl-CoA synthetase (AMP-forming)/AMP-acid ligase II